jgi:chaperonin GroES
LNQLIDAGHLANTGGGFLGRGMRIASGETRFSPGEWKKVDITGGTMRDNVLPLPVQQPSQVLFQLLGLLIEAAKEVSSVQDVMTGGGGQNMPATTVLAQIEQGMKVFTAIYKRIHRSFKGELKLLYRLNGIYLRDQEYFSVLDDQTAIGKVDYEDQSLDVIPVSDPSLATDLQKMAKVQAMMQFGPLLDQNAVAQEGLRLMNVSQPEKYLPKQQGPSPEQLQSLAEIEIKRKEAEAKVLDAAASAAQKYSTALKNVAETDALGVDNVVNSQELTLLLQSLKLITGNQGNEATGSQGLVGQPPNAGVPGVSPAPQEGLARIAGPEQGGMG